ncbi:hypothetical protein FOL47_007552 [Perkinsus chesapeaki]|uniref:Uncharacterized protein n=1 Tax=Perkinsus chesapeaki TaxID=330153 RepID=A0A7J6MWK5_PERCH|nr:hypothetical protein FOL47_007552 [Perkinsus chesapeaki]
MFSRLLILAAILNIVFCGRHEHNPERSLKGQICFEKSVERTNFKGVFNAASSPSEEPRCHDMLLHHDRRIEILDDPGTAEHFPKNVGLSLTAKDLELADSNTLDVKVRIKKKGRKANPCCAPSTIPAKIRFKDNIVKAIKSDHQSLYAKLFGELVQDEKEEQLSHSSRRGGASLTDDADDISDAMQNLFGKDKKKNAAESHKDEKTQKRSAEGEICFEPSLEERSFKGVFKYTASVPKKSLRCHAMLLHHDRRIEILDDPGTAEHFPKNVGLSLTAKDLELADSNTLDVKVRIKKKGRKANPCCAPSTIPAKIRFKDNIVKAIKSDHQSLYAKLFGELVQDEKEEQLSHSSRRGGASLTDNADDISDDMRNLFGKDKKKDAAESHKDEKAQKRSAEGEICFEPSLEERSFKGVFKYTASVPKKSLRCHAMLLHHDRRIGILDDRGTVGNFPKNVGLSLTTKELELADSNTLDVKVRIKKKGRKANPCCAPNTIPAKIRFKDNIVKAIKSDDQSLYAKLFGELVEDEKEKHQSNKRRGPSPTDDVDDNAMRNLFEEKGAKTAAPSRTAKGAGNDLSETFDKGEICVNHDKQLTKKMKKELGISDFGQEHECSPFVLSRAPQGLLLKTGLFSVTAYQPQNVKFSGELLEVVDNIEMGSNARRTQGHYLVLNMHIKGRSGKTVRVMGWFNVENDGDRKKLKGILSDNIDNSLY